MSTNEERNHAQLSAALTDVKKYLYAYVESRGAPDRGTVPAAPTGEEYGALTSLQSMFSLSDFERRVLVLCAGVELDDEISRLCSRCLGAIKRLRQISVWRWPPFPSPTGARLRLTAPCADGC